MRSIRGLATLLLLLAGCVDGGNEGNGPVGNLSCESGCTGDGLSVSLGEISLGHRIERQLRLRNTGDALSTNRMFLDAGGGLTASLQCETGCPGGRLESGALLVVQLAWAPTEAGTLDAGPQLHLGDSRVPLRVQGEAHPVDLVCDGDAITFGPVAEGGREVHRLTCENRGAGPLDLSLTGLPAGFAVDRAGRSLQRGANADFAIAFSGTASSSGIARVVLPDGTTVHSVRLAGTVGEPLEVLPAQPGDGCRFFGWVAPGAVGELPLELRNAGNGVLDVKGMQVKGDGAFSLTSGSQAFSLAPGESREVRVRFAPTAIGMRQTSFAIDAGDHRVSLCVEGGGGGPRLLCDTTPVDFGTTRVGSPRVHTIRCSNEGWDDPTTESDGLFLAAIEATGNGFRVEAPVSNGPWSAGSSFEIPVFHDPLEAGASTGSVTIRSRDGAVAVVDLSGAGRELPACNYEITPSLEFGEVGGHRVTLPVVLTNQGATDCLLSDARIEGDASFSLDNQLPAELGPYERLSIPVTFAAAAGRGDASASLAFSISADEPSVRIALHGRSTSPCLRSRSAETWIGAASPDCTADAREMLLINECDDPVTLTGAAFHSGDSFRIQSGPSFPTVIEPGFTASFTADYLPLAAAAPGDFDALEVSVLGWDLPLLLQVRGSSGNVTTEHFEASPAVDVLLVMDNSSGVDYFHFWNYAEAFFSQGPAADFHLGVTTTGVDGWGTGPLGYQGSLCGGGAGGNEHGRLYPADGYSPRIIDSSMSPAVRDAAWLQNLQVGICHGTERGLEAVRLALSPPLITHADVQETALPADGNLGFLRDDAELHVVFFSDEEDQSPLAVERYVAFLRGMKDDRRKVKAHALAGPVSGCSQAEASQRYPAITQAFGGTFISYCELSATAILERLGQAILAPRRCFQLEREPARTAATMQESLEVRVNGQRVNAMGSRGELIWTWDSAANSVCFASARAPGSQIEIDYHRRCL